MSHELQAAEEQCPYHSCIPSWGNSSFLQLSWLPGKICLRPLGVKGPGLEGAEPSGTNSRKKGRGILSFGGQLENGVGNQKEREEGPGETAGWTKEGKVAKKGPGNPARQRLASISSPGEGPHARFYVLVEPGLHCNLIRCHRAYSVHWLCAGGCFRQLKASLVVQKVKNLPAVQETRFNPWVRKISWRRAWLLTPVLLPGESHGQRSLAGYSPWGHKEWNTTEWLMLSPLSFREIKRGWPAGEGSRAQNLEAGVIKNWLHQGPIQGLLHIWSSGF